MNRRSATAVASLLLLSILRLGAQPAGQYGHITIEDADLLPASEYAARREAVLTAMDSSQAMVVRAAERQVRNGDVKYDYRQRSNMLYLTGVTEDECAILLAPRGVKVDGSIARVVLFVSPRNAMTEAFERPRMGPKVASDITGIPVVVTYSRLPEVLDSLLPHISMLYYDGWGHRTVSEPIVDNAYFWEQEITRDLRKRSAALAVRNAGSVLDGFRVVKSPAEIALLRRAAGISVQAHRTTMASARPGMNEYELKATMEYTFHRLGAEGPGYPSIVGSGPNSTILHYDEDRRQTKPGDLVVMDCGAEYHGYSSDVTRTFPISGTFTEEQRAIYDLVQRAQELAIRACRPGADFRKPHVMAQRTIAAGLVELGIIAGEEEASRYFNHGTSHYIGLDVHDVGAMGELRPGMILTVEPGIYIRAGSPCDPKWWNIGVRIEDDILITETGNENLSGALAHTSAEIEALLKEAQGKMTQ